ncbi:hypothetical protein F5878DRAFT_665399 [Lentinula raphanica]|uniref:Uncharacterized protein n=1 Tax=Lentinula raphanica TaxID=153919 RepID=A0AA38NZX3_9AGAR|nr:hypothetical protein F5878DRAFT_665399 [Lentinula raphanica]
MHPLQPIRPKFARSALLWGALMLFLSFHDHFGGTPVIKGVLAAPMNRNIPPSQQVDQHEHAQKEGVTLAQLEMGTQPLAHPGMQHVTSPPLARPVNPDNFRQNPQPVILPYLLPALPAQPAQPGGHPYQYAHPSESYSGMQPPAYPVHPDYSVVIELHLNRRRGQSKTARDDWEKSVLVSEYLTLIGAPSVFAISQPEDQGESSVKKGPGLGGSRRLATPGKSIGTLTYVSSPESTASVYSALEEFLEGIKHKRAETNLLYLTDALSDAEEKFRVDLNDDWYRYLGAMLGAHGTGSGGMIPKEDVETQVKYHEMFVEVMQHPALESYKDQLRWQWQ